MIQRVLALSLILSLLLPSIALAQNTLLPESAGDCSIYSTSDYRSKTKYLELNPAPGSNEGRKKQTEFLGCAIKTGHIHMWMVPYFITYITEFFIAIAGVISLLFVIIGGFWYMTGGITDDKEKGKKTIMYALVGFVLTLLAWIIVNVIQVQITS